MEKLVLSNSIDINAPAARVWQTLTNPELTRQYMFGCETVSEWKIGSPLLWKGAADSKIYVKGNIVKLEPERFLRYTIFDPNGPLEDIPENYLTVTYSLTPKGDSTTLEITQAGFESAGNGEARHKESAEGWPAIMLGIKEVAEGKADSRATSTS